MNSEKRIMNNCGCRFAPFVVSFFRVWFVFSEAIVLSKACLRHGAKEVNPGSPFWKSLLLFFEPKVLTADAGEYVPLLW